MAVVADELLLMVRANVGQAMAGLSAVEAKASGMGTKIMGAGKLAGKALLGVGAVAGVIGVAAGKMSLDFEKSMAQIEALVGVPKDEMKELEDAALRMGKEFGVSADDAAGGLFFLKSAGLDTADAITALEQAAAASAMGLGSMEDLANTATTAMSNFGITSEQAFDDITTAARLAKADPSELGRIMNRNSATANLLGLSYEELGGLSALLTRKFGDASMSGTALGAVMNKMVKPSMQAKDMLAKIGMTSKQMQESVSEKGLTGALFDLNDAFAEQGIATADWIAKVMEDSRGIKGAAAILGTGGKELDEIMQGMNDSTGSLAAGWDVMAETGSVKLKKAFESIKSALIPIGDAIVKVVVPAIEIVAGWITKLVEMFQGPASGALGTFSTKFQDVFGTIVTAVRNTIGFIVDHWHDVTDIFTDVFGSSDVSGNLGEIASVFQDVFGTIASTIQGAADYIVSHWDEIMAAFRTTLQTLKDVWDEIYAVVQPIIAAFIDFVMTQVGEFMTWWNDIWPMLKEVIVKVLEVVQRIWQRAWGAIKDHLLPIFKAIMKIVGGALDIIKGIIKTVLAIITGHWGAAWEGIKQILSGVWEIIQGVVEGGWEIIKTVWDAGIAFIKNAWDVFWTILGEGIKGIWEGIVAGVKAGVNAVLGVIEGFINGAIANINAVISLANKVPGIEIGTISQISVPRLATGGTVMSSGLAMVGERGPELVGLPRGASVMPLTGQNAVTPTQQNAATNQTIVVQIGDEEFARFALDKTGLSGMRTARRQR